MNDPQQKTLKSLRAFYSLSDPEGIRTPDRLLRRQMLYPTELRDLKRKGQLVSSLVLSGWQDSNLRPPAPKAGAIPGYATPRTGCEFTQIYFCLNFFFLQRLFFSFPLFLIVKSIHLTYFCSPLIRKTQGKVGEWLKPTVC